MSARYRVDPRKALEVIMWLAGRQSPMDFYHILKITYYADKYHLNKYGRPIIGDTYQAYNHGPVAKTLYDLLKADGLALQALDAYTDGSNGDLPFTVKGGYWVHPTRSCYTRFLSESDIEALELSFKENVNKSFKELERMTHEEEGWKKAFPLNAMDYEYLIDDSPDRASKIEDISARPRSLRCH